MGSTPIQRSRILVVDDEHANTRFLERLFARAGYTEVLSTTDSRCALELYRGFAPDLVLLDLRMPHVDGFALLADLVAETPAEDFRPVVVLTADSSVEARERALSAGATEFITKPFYPFEILLRTGNLLRMRSLHLELRERNRSLEERVLERTRDLERAQSEMLHRLAQAVEARDGATAEHTRRVGENSAVLASALGLGREQVELIRRAAPLHDVGKIGIPDAVLLKRDVLSAEEFALAKTHTTIGARILSRGESPLLHTAERIALAHHERWDGSGYPQGLAGEEIPLEARIVAVVDVADALSHPRPYRSAWPAERVRQEIRDQSGLHFDPRVAEAWLELDRSAALLR